MQKFFIDYIQRIFDKDRAKKILKNLRTWSKKLVNKSPKEITSVLSKEFPLWDVLNIPNEWKEISLEFCFR